MSKRQRISYLDEQIRLLEEKLGYSSSDIDDDALIDVEKDSYGNVLIMKSHVEDSEIIQPLPVSKLPDPRCGFRSHEVKKQQKKLNKKARTVDFADSTPPVENSGTYVIHKKVDGCSMKPLSGLERTAQELFGGDKKSNDNSGGTCNTSRPTHYATLSETGKLPLYCRVCQIQCYDMTEYNQHTTSETHATRVKESAYQNTCKMCKVQFTSPVQLQEHLGGKKHKMRLEELQQKQHQQQEQHWHI